MIVADFRYKEKPPQVYLKILPHTLRFAQQKPTFHDRKTYVSAKENIGFPFEKHKKDKRK